MYALDQLNDKQLAMLDKTYYHRLANIAYIDDMVASLINKLESKGILENTYIIYTTDNGTMSSSVMQVLN